MHKVWLVTGSGNGLGRDIAEAALAAGHCVVAGARRLEELDSLAAQYAERLRPGQAWAAIQARPGLTAELAALLRGPNEPARRDALWYLKANHEALPAELLAPVREALDATADSVGTRIAADTTLPAETFDDDCLVAARLARENSGRAANFVEPLRRLQAVLAGQPTNSGRGSEGQAALAAWLQRNDPVVPR